MEESGVFEYWFCVDICFRFLRFGSRLMSLKTKGRGIPLWGLAFASFFISHSSPNQCRNCTGISAFRMEYHV